MLDSTAGYDFEVTGRDHYLCFHDLVLEEGEMFVGGDSPVIGRDIRGSLTFIPAEIGAHGWSIPRNRRNSFTALHISPDSVPDRIVRLLDDPAVYFRDAPLAATLQKVSRTLQREAPFIDLATESLSNLALVEFVRWRERGATPRAEPVKLSDDKVALVRSYVLEHLGSRITLSELADLVSYSRFHFSRAYKAATGRSPYRDVLELRVRRAEEMLLRGDPPDLTAAHCGFNGRAQLARSVREIGGRSLRDYFSS